MNVQVHYQGLDHTPWMDAFLSSRVQKLRRYFNGTASLLISVRCEGMNFCTTLSIHYLNHYQAFTCEGFNLYESFTGALDKASRTMSEHKRYMKDKINRRYTALKDVA